ncbi:MAG: T9SS type A sorting domain-containing protein [Bacteroidetes bacterium]|nr:T9SS type A sorting domain-containing protein [Bacteroidota bacterium]
MKQLLRPLFMLILTGCIASSHAQIYSYTTDTAGAVASVATNAAGLGLVRVNGATRPSSPCSTGYSSTTFDSGQVYNTGKAGIQAEVAANSGYKLSVTGFSVGLRRSGTGPVNVRLAYSTDHGATWIDKGSDDAPGTGSCGSTATASWTTSFNVPVDSTLLFRVYGFHASGLTGTLQALNLTINGTVTTATSITTAAASFGPFCQSSSDTISVPFTSVGSFTDSFHVQLSDASGVFPSDATSSLIGAGTTSPVTAVIPAGTTAGIGYRVRVVNANPVYYTSADNGSDIVINAPVSPSVSITGSPAAVCPANAITFSVSNVTNGGTTPSYTWYLNNAGAGSGSTYTLSSPADNDSVYAVVTSNYSCLTTTTANSNTLVATVYPTASTTLYDTICPGAGYTFNGNTQTTAGTYTANLNTVHGCDSIVTLHLYVKPMLTGAVHASICQGDAYLFNGTSYTAAGSYNDTVRCDSIVTLTLTYKTVHTSAMSASFCQGDAYTFDGMTYTAAGSYNDTVRCDSIVTLTLTYKTVHTSAVSASFCQGDSYTFNGTSYTAAGSYNDTIRCDSIVTLTLTYKPVHIASISAAICQGQAYTINGHNYSAAGTYNDTISCDSIVTLTLAVNSIPSPTVTASGATLSTGSFSSYQWFLNGGQITGATSQSYTATQNGDYTVLVTNASGCSDTSAIYTLTGVGITEADALHAVVYPTPTDGMLYIQAAGLVHIELLDMIGRTVYVQDQAKASDHALIDLSAFGNGMYTLVLRGAGNAISIRNIIKK